MFINSIAPYSNGVIGTIANDNPFTRFNKPLATGQVIPFGVLVSEDADGNVVLGNPDGSTILGISMFDSQVALRIGADAPAYQAGQGQGQGVTFCSQGAIYIASTDGATRGGVVYADKATGALTETSGADTVEVPNGKFLATEVAGEAVGIKLNVL